MRNATVISFLETIARPDWQEDYDNCGLLIGAPDDICSGALVCLDVTPAVVAEAVQRKASLIVAHHPLIFRGLMKIGPDTEIGRTVIDAVKNQVSVYAIHTNLDNVLPGVNSEIGARIGLRNLKPLTEKQAGSGSVPGPGHRLGSGALGDLPEAMTEASFLAHLNQIFGTPVIRHSALTNKKIGRVALCGGAGSFLISKALGENADAFITSDLKYHEFFNAEGRILLTDVGHFESEQFTIDFLAGEISKKFPNFAVLKAETRTNPVHYHL